MARRKAPRVTRTPEEHRLHVEALDAQQRERSEAGKSNKVGKPKSKPSRAAQQPTKRLHEMKLYPRDWYV